MGRWRRGVRSCGSTSGHSRTRCCHGHWDSTPSPPPPISLPDSKQAHDTHTTQPHTPRDTHDTPPHTPHTVATQLQAVHLGHAPVRHGFAGGDDAAARAGLLRLAVPRVGGPRLLHDPQYLLPPPPLFSFCFLVSFSLFLFRLRVFVCSSSFVLFPLAARSSSSHAGAGRGDHLSRYAHTPHDTRTTHAAHARARC